MDYKDINKLLEKYFDGNSTLEEEAFLKEYFAGENLPKEHIYLKKMFQYFIESKENIKLDLNAKQELQTFLDDKWKNETKVRFSRTLKWASSIAALFILLFGIYYLSNNPFNKMKDTYKDPELAYAETKRTLLLISDYMNKKTSNLKYLAEIDKSYKKLNKLGELDKIVTTLKTKKP
jgi:hypothetical protein